VREMEGFAPAVLVEGGGEVVVLVHDVGVVTGALGVVLLLEVILVVLGDLAGLPEIRKNGNERGSVVGSSREICARQVPSCSLQIRDNAGRGEAPRTSHGRQCGSNGVVDALGIEVTGHVAEVEPRRFGRHGSCAAGGSRTCLWADDLIGRSFCEPPDLLIVR
jgi:hypothetical protein